MGYKVKNKIVSLLSVGLLVLGISGCNSEPKAVDQAKDKLWWEFQDNITKATCKPSEVESVWLIDCKTNESNHALFWVQIHSDTEYTIWAANGKAMQYKDKFTKTPVSEFYLNGTYPNVEKALKSYSGS